MPAVVAVPLAVHGLVPLLQNSVSGDGHGLWLVLRPVAAEAAVPGPIMVNVTPVLLEVAAACSVTVGLVKAVM